MINFRGTHLCVEMLKRYFVRERLGTPALTASLCYYSECVYVCCVNGFQFNSHLGTFYFGSNLMVALVKEPLFYFLQKFPNFCVQIYSFG